MSESPLFLLAGNGPYLNRGCEAIMRGTVKILRANFEKPRFLSISHFNSDKQFNEQRNNETDGEIEHLSSYRLNRDEVIQNWYKVRTWKHIYRHYFNGKRLGESIYGDMIPRLDEITAVLSIGGDNYSLDYGVPSLFTMLDDIVLERDRPLIIWGASVGPFDNKPDYEKYMTRHLQDVTGIFARESDSIDYLGKIGVRDNVYPVADPAFLMEAKKPTWNGEEFLIEDGAIGLNFSPLMAKYVTGGDVEAWARIASNIITSLSREARRPIYLIPHVTTPHSDDRQFMEMAWTMAGQPRGVMITPGGLNAEETKWLIGQMDIFCGARTHATIAAMSMMVPTLSLAYSVKALGINQDIFGHHSYIVRPDELRPDTVIRIVNKLSASSDEVKGVLRARMPEVKEKAMSACPILRHLLEGRLPK